MPCPAPGRRRRPRRVLPLPLKEVPAKWATIDRLDSAEHPAATVGSSGVPMENSPFTVRHGPVGARSTARPDRTELSFLPSTQTSSRARTLERRPKISSVAPTRTHAHSTHHWPAVLASGK